MRKLTLLLAAMLSLTVAVWAQGSGGGAGGGAAAGGGQGAGASGNSAAGGHATGGGGNGGMTTSDNGQVVSGGHHHGNTLEGCLVQQGSDFYIQHGKSMVHVLPPSGEDWSANVNKKVKVYGNSNSQMAAAGNTAIPVDPNAPANGKSSNIKERDMASAAQGTNVPNAVTTPDQNPPAANASLAGSGALPQGSEVNVSKNGGDFTATRLEVKGGTCNAKH